MRRSVRLGLYIIALWLTFYTALSQAVTVAHLDQATIVVPDRSSAALSQGLKAAFTQVLIKLSGNPFVMTLPTVQNAAPDLEQWVQSYSYASATDPQGQKQLSLQIQFDRRGLKQLLQEAGQPIWPDNRPLTLIYLDNSAAVMQPEMTAKAKQRGLPVIFPVMDLSDQEIVGDQLTQQIMPEQVKALSARYGVSSVMIAHLTKGDDGNWQASGQYFFNGQENAWQVSGANQQAVMIKVLNQLTRMMVSHLVVTDNDALKSTVTMNVAGVNDIAAYAKVMHYLQQKEGVTGVAVKDVGATGVLFSVNITGGMDHFQKILAADARLRPVRTALTDDSHRADLYYYW